MPTGRRSTRRGAPGRARSRPARQRPDHGRHPGSLNRGSRHPEPVRACPRRRHRCDSGRRVPAWWQLADRSGGSGECDRDGGRRHRRVRVAGPRPGQRLPRPADHRGHARVRAWVFSRTAPISRRGTWSSIKRPPSPFASGTGPRAATGSRSTRGRPKLDRSAAHLDDREDLVQLGVRDRQLVRAAHDPVTIDREDPWLERRPHSSVTSVAMREFARSGRGRVGAGRRRPGACTARR